MRISTLPVIKDFKLKFRPDDWDGEDGSVAIRQARTGDAVRQGNLFADQTQIIDDEELGRIQLKRKWNPEELKRYRAFLTLSSSNLSTDDGEAIFRFKEVKGGSRLAMSQAEFENAWDSLPLELTDEIYEYVLEVNPQWDFSRGED